MISCFCDFSDFLALTAPSFSHADDCNTPYPLSPPSPTFCRPPSPPPPPPSGRLPNKLFRASSQCCFSSLIMNLSALLSLISTVISQYGAFNPCQPPDYDQRLFSCGKIFALMTRIYAEAPALVLNSPFHSAVALFAYLLKIRDIIFCSDDNILKMLTIRYYKLRLIILFIQHWPMS